MTASPDLVIRGGTIADGSGGDLFEADVAIRDGRITEVGQIAAKGRDEINARGRLVAPAFPGNGRAFRITWTGSASAASTSTSARNCRTRRFACMSWASAARAAIHR